MNASPHPRHIGLLLAAAALCLGSVLGYAGYTGQVWEDYLITFRYSRNLAEGRGLVYNPGERVHGFTSPLGTLVPAGLYALSDRSEAAALALFRACSALAFAGGGLLLVGACLREPGPWPLVSAGGLALLYATDAKGVAFSANGMETGFVLLFAAWGLWLVRRPGADPWRWRGLVWAGLLWARPDGCVHAAALALAELAFGATPRRRLPASWAKSGLVCALLYGPWLAAAWAYFGSPIPNTAAAKAVYFGPYSDYVLRALRHFPSRFVAKNVGIFAPVYYGGLAHSSWPDWIGGVAAGLVLACCCYWVVPLNDRLGRAASLCFTVLCVYDVFIPVVFPWYYPPTALFGAVTVARGVPGLACALVGDRREGMSLASGLLGIAVAASATLLGLTACQAAFHQHVIEDGNRRRIGEWLAAHTRTDDLLYLEPLGYIGYFSGCRVADFPGLVSRRVVEMRRQRALDFVGVLRELRPDWVVARPNQVRDMVAVGLTPRYYVPVQRFDVTSDVADYLPIPGRELLEFDARFTVFQKVSEPPAERRR